VRGKRLLARQLNADRNGTLAGFRLGYGNRRLFSSFFGKPVLIAQSLCVKLESELHLPRTKALVQRLRTAYVASGVSIGKLAQELGGVLTAPGITEIFGERANPTSEQNARNS
jgi:hypothetical protein